MAVTPTKSASDDRGYKIITLPNKLTVILVSDPTTDKSAASLDVRVGHLSDPNNLPGLAHFLEHMLFMGTSKYPDENEYNTYLSSHGGGSNAYTDTEDTNYYFDVNAPHFSGAIDRFAQFFIKPLFTESATERELKAVDSENSKNKQNDFWRSFQLMKGLARPDHPFSKFGTGNSSTIKDDPSTGVSVREALLAFHAKFYSADVMKLSVIGKESLEELEKMVVESFSDIPNKNIGNPVFSGEPYTAKELRKAMEVVPIKENRSLDIAFPLCAIRDFYKSKPASYISHLIGHESAGSIISYLKKKNWANDLWGGPARSCSDWSSFQIGIDLTEEGMDHIDEIVDVCFGYINMLKKEGPKEWIFKENLEVSSNTFRFLSKSRPQGYACSLAEKLQNYEHEDVLSGPYLASKYDPELISKILGYLRSDNMIVTVTGRKFKGNTSKVEKWYGTEYNERPIEEEKITRWDGISFPESDLHLPEKNELIATDFELRDSSGFNAAPKLIVNTDLARVWYKPDDKFSMPKLNVMATLQAPSVYSDPDSYCCAQLFVSCLNEIMNEFSYMASMAGLSSSVSSSRVGIEVTVSGFNHKLHVLMGKVFETISTFDKTLTTALFNRIKEKTTKTMKNFFYGQPYSHAGQATDMILGPVMFSVHERIEAVENITIEDLKIFASRLLKRTSVEMLVHGNATLEEAKRFLDVIITSIEPKPIYPSSKPNHRVARLTRGRDYVYRFKCYNDQEANSCTQDVFQLVPDTVEDTAECYFLAHLLNEPAFDILRTKETLGYIVWSGRKNTETILNLSFIIQGDANPPDYLSERVEAFLVTFRQKITDMEEIEFGENKQAVIDKLLEKDKNLSEESYRYFAQINKGMYVFEKSKLMADVVEGMDKASILKFFDAFLAAGGEKRCKLSTRVYGKDVAMPIVEGEEGGMEVVKDLHEFKRGMDLWPLGMSPDLSGFE